MERVASLFVGGLRSCTISLYFFATGPATSEISLNLSPLHYVTVFKAIVLGKSVDGNVVVKIIEILDDAVSPRSLHLSSCSFGEEGPSGTFHILLDNAGCP